MVTTIRNPRIPRTWEQRMNILRLREELDNYRWDGNVDMLEHVIWVNGMIQNIIWEGFLMRDRKRIIALRKTLPKVWQAIVNELWNPDPHQEYKILVEAFMKSI